MRDNRFQTYNSDTPASPRVRADARDRHLVRLGRWRQTDGHLAPYGSDELGGGSERRARRRTGRGASTELTQVADGRRTIIENPPLRTHLQAVGDMDPEVTGRARRLLAAQPEQCQRAAPAESLGCDVIEKLASVLGVHTLVRSVIKLPNS